jgi:hypothetical protein
VSLDPWNDPAARVPFDLDSAESRRFEERTVEELRKVLMGSDGLVVFDDIALVGSRDARRVQGS